MLDSILFGCMLHSKFHSMCCSVLCICLRTSLCAVRSTTLCAILCSALYSIPFYVLLYCILCSWPFCSLDSILLPIPFYSTLFHSFLV